MSKYYNFYCQICGNPFEAKRKDKKTCMKICRTILSQLKDPNISNSEYDSLSPEEKEDVNNAVEDIQSGIPRTQNVNKDNPIITNEEIEAEESADEEGSDDEDGDSKEEETDDKA